MKFLSFNCKGLANTPKKLTLHKHFSTKPVDLILLQETLGEAQHTSRVLQSLCPGWEFIALDAMGCSGGLALGYNPRTINPKST